MYLLISQFNLLTFALNTLMINSTCLHKNLKSTQKSWWTLLTSYKPTCHWNFLSLILSSVITGPSHLYTPFSGNYRYHSCDLFTFLINYWMLCWEAFIWSQRLKISNICWSFTMTYCWWERYSMHGHQLCCAIYTSIYMYIFQRDI